MDGLCNALIFCWFFFKIFINKELENKSNVLKYSKFKINQNAILLLFTPNSFQNIKSIKPALNIQWVKIMKFISHFKNIKDMKPQKKIRIGKK